MYPISLECPAHYSLRRLSPFLGTLQVTEVPGARGLSADGVNWQVQLLGEVRAINRAGIESADWRYFVYGYWNRTQGLARVPVHPVLGRQTESPSLPALIGVLEAGADIPFPPADNLELWLLDQSHQLPLALLQSVKGDAPPPETYDVAWHPNAHGDTSFVAPSLSGKAYASPWPHRDLLRRRVQAAAGTAPRAQWFLRDAKGNGLGLGGPRIGPALYGRRLDRTGFPELLLRERWDEPTDQMLVRDFLDWQAPLLLTLSGLLASTRDRLEHAACRRPMALFKVRRLIPEVRNRDVIQTPLVEAALRNALA